MYSKNHALKHRHAVAYRFENWAAYNYVNNGNLNIKQQQQQQQVHATHTQTHKCTWLPTTMVRKFISICNFI